MMKEMIINNLRAGEVKLGAAALSKF